MIPGDFVCSECRIGFDEHDLYVKHYEDVHPKSEPAAEPVMVSIRSAKPAGRAVTLTDAAVTKVAEMLATEDEGAVLRFGIRPGGCSGFSYDVHFDTEVTEQDTVEEFGEDVTVVIDPESLPMLRGSTLDYKDGLMGSGLVIDNPNETRSCGCGKSFG